MVQIMKTDKTALKFNQMCIVFFTAFAFTFNLTWLTGIVGLILITGTVFPKAGLFKLFYKHVVKRTGILKPVISDEDISPHLFAQGLGGFFLAFSYFTLTIFNSAILGWVLSLAVLFLALINILFNFCMGCFIYYQLQRSGFPAISRGVKD